MDATLILMVFLQFALLFNQKRLFNTRMGPVHDIIEDYFGFSISGNQYYRRTRHFHHEKELLSQVFVNRVLPRLIRTIESKHPNFDKLNLVLDSGTTITPIFLELIREGLPIEKDRVSIYTNNLAGIDEIHKLSERALGVCKLGERDITLIGGLPLNKYRATTGERRKTV